MSEPELWNRWVARALADRGRVAAETLADLLERTPQHVDLGEVLCERGLVAPDEVAPLRVSAAPSACANCRALVVARDRSAVACPSCGGDLGGERPAARLGDYDIFGLLGRGAAGIVYRARRRGEAERVALKVLRPERMDSARAVKRFERERKLGERLVHPGIVRLLDGGMIDKTPYLAMELVDGVALSTLLRAGPIGVERALGIGRDIALALEHAHEKGVVHRDLKPQNVLVDGGTGKPKVLDFGLATDVSGVAVTAITAEGVSVGTVGYIAPERIERPEEPATPAGDIWSLGGILYEGIYGAPPFVGKSFGQIADRVTDADPSWRPETGWDEPSEAARRVVECCLAKDPRRRYAGARELIDDIERVLAGAPVDELTADRNTSRRLPAVSAAPRRRGWWRWWRWWGGP